MLFVFAVCIWGFAFKREVFQNPSGDKRVCLIPIKWFVLIPLFSPMLYLIGLFFSFSYEEMKRLLQLDIFCYPLYGLLLFGHRSGCFDSFGFVLDGPFLSKPQFQKICSFLFKSRDNFNRLCLSDYGFTSWCLV